MGKGRSEYSEFMKNAQLLAGEGWDDYPDFQEMCKQYAQTRLGPILQDQFKAVFDYAWREGHSNGYEEVAMTFDDILDILEKFVLRD